VCDMPTLFWDTRNVTFSQMKSSSVCGINFFKENGVGPSLPKNAEQALEDCRTSIYRQRSERDYEALYASRLANRRTSLVVADMASKILRRVTLAHHGGEK
jgi:hypothetical protein